MCKTLCFTNALTFVQSFSIVACADFDRGRYRQLWELHGEAMVGGANGGAGAGAAVSNLAATMAQVTLTSLAAASCTLEPAKKRLPATMTVGKLKQLCKRLFKVDTDQQVWRNTWCIVFRFE